MVTLRREPGRTTFPIPTGTYIPWIHGPNYKHTVALVCPTCGAAFCLADHTINRDGVVMPSVVCPHGCGFHDMVQVQLTEDMSCIVSH